MIFFLSKKPSLKLFYHRQVAWQICLIMLFLFFIGGRTEAQKGLIDKNLTFIEEIGDVEVIDLYEDKKGYLWVVTPSRLIRFDGCTGKSFSLFPFKVKSCLLFYEDKYNRIWFELESVWQGKILLSYNSYKKKLETIQKKVYHLEIHNDELLIVIQKLSDSLELHYLGLKQKEIKIITYYHEIKGSITRLKIDTIGNIWIGIKKSLYFFNSQTSQFQIFSEITSAVRKIYEDTSGNIWINTKDKEGLYCYNYQINALGHFGEVKGSLNQIHEDAFGNIWIGTFTDLYLYDNQLDSFRQFKKTIGQVEQIYEDACSNIWIKTWDSLYLYHNQKGSLEEITKWVKQIYEDGFSNIWIGTLHGLYLYDNQIDSIRKFEKILGAIGVIYEDISNNIWIGTDKHGLYSYKQQTNNLQQVGDITGVIETIYQDASGNIWIKDWEGLYLYHNQKNILHLFEEGYIYDKIEQIYEDAYQNIWIKAGWYVYKYDNQTNRLQYITDNYVDEMGGVHVIYKDTFGNIWIGAEDGLYHNHSVGVSDNLQKFKQILDNAFPIYEDASGKVWISTRENGLYLYNSQNGDLQQFDKATSRVEQIHEDTFGNIWIDTWNNSLYFYNNQTDKLECFKELTNVTQIQEDASGNVWIGNWSGLYFYDNHKKHLHHFKEIEGYVKHIHEDVSKNIWIIAEEGLYFYNYQINDLQFLNEIKGSLKQIHEDTSGNLWIKTWNNSLYFYNNQTDKLEYFKELTNVTHIQEDASGNVWIGNRNGLYFYDNHWRHLHHFREIKGYVTHIQEDASGNVWIGNRNGLYFYDNHRRHLHHFREIKGSTKQIHEDASKNIWIIAEEGLYFYNYQINDLQFLNEIKGSLRQIHEDVSGNIWIGTWKNGMYLYNKQINKLRHFKEIKDGDKKVFEDIYGNICIVVEHETIYLYSSNSGDFSVLPNSGLGKLIINEDYMLWASDDKIFKYSNKKQKSSQILSIPGKEIKTLKRDCFGNLWCRTNTTLYYLHFTINEHTQTEFYTYYKINLFQNAFSFFSRMTNQLKLNSQKNEIPKSGLYKLYKEVFISQLEAFQDSLIQKPHLHLTNLKINNTNINWHNINPDTLRGITYNGSFKNHPPLPNDLKLKYTKNDITLQFTGIYLPNPQAVRYQWKLQGWDKNWSEISDQREVSYTNLSPGDYTFQVFAMNEYGKWTEEPATYSFTILPPWWATWWARIGFVLAAASLVAFGAYDLAKRRAKEQLHQLQIEKQAETHKLELEKVRREEQEKTTNRLSQNFHDSSGQDITKVQQLLGIIQLFMPEENKPLKNYLSQVQRKITTLRDNIRNFTWVIDPVKDTLFHTVERLAKMGTEFFEDTAIKFNIKGLDSNWKAIPLGAAVRQNITMIFREAMTNCLKYSECEYARLEVKIDETGNQLTITFLDDGQGFKVATTALGNGLTNMQTRAANIQANLEINAQMGQGTKIELQMQIPQTR